MDLKKFRFDYKLSQSDLAELFGCKQGHISNIEAGSRSVTALQIRLLIEKYGADVISKYAEPGEIPATITVNAPHIKENSGQVNGGGGNTQNNTNADKDLITVLKQQSDQITTLLQQQQTFLAQQTTFLTQQAELIAIIKAAHKQ